MRTTPLVKAALSIVTLACFVPIAGAGCGGDTIDFPAPAPAPPSPNHGGEAATATPPPAPREPNQPADVGSSHVDTSVFATASAAHWLKCSYSGPAITVATRTGEDGEVIARGKNLDKRLARPGVRVTQAQLDACADKLRDTCAWSQMFVECDFRGAIAIGASCIDDLQCASGYCTGDPNGQASERCGVCAVRKTLGESCDDSGAPSVPCAFGLVCHHDLCKALLPAGAACGDEPCGAGLVCRQDSHTCGPRLPAGAACGPIVQEGPVRLSECHESLLCKAGICTAELPIKAVLIGESCAPEAGKRVLCAQSTCDGATLRCVAGGQTNRPEVADADPVCH